jgi:hypothetical protein
MRHIRKLLVSFALLATLLGPGIALAAPQSVAHTTIHHQLAANHGHSYRDGVIWGS